MPYFLIHFYKLRNILITINHNYHSLLLLLIHIHNDVINVEDDDKDKENRRIYKLLHSEYYHRKAFRRKNLVYQMHQLFNSNYFHNENEMIQPAAANSIDITLENSQYNDDTMPLSFILLFNNLLFAYNFLMKFILSNNYYGQSYLFAKIIDS